MKLPIGQIICGDCRKVMKGWDMSNCCIITDPPYGISIVENSGRLKDLGYQPIINDDKQQNINFLLKSSKGQIIFGGNYFQLPISRGWIIWDKQGGKITPFNFGECELVWTSFSFTPIIIKHIWDGWRRDSDKGIKRTHPTQKPTGLLEIIIKKFTKPNTIILDPFCGSGTTCVAAEMLGRRWIGIDVSKKWCELSRRRIEVAKRNPGLKLFL